MGVLRFPSAFALAFVLTASMFWALSILINRSVSKADLRTVAKIEFTRLRHDSELRTRVRQQKTQRVETAQVQNTPQISINLGQGTGKMEVLPPNIDTSAVLSGLSLGLGGEGAGGGGPATADRDVVPLVRIEPDYPARAAQRGIEGYVVVRFTITPAGTIKDATVVDAQPQGIFDSAAIEAVSRWKYKPKIDGGNPVERAGVQVRLAFQLEK